MLRIAASSCAKHRVTKAAENPLLDVRNFHGKNNLQRESNSSLDLFANFLDLAKKWKLKEVISHLQYFFCAQTAESHNAFCPLLFGIAPKSNKKL
jgi:hypothetical protein